MQSYDPIPTLEARTKVIDKAHRDGHIIVKSVNYVLQLDLDTLHQVDFASRMYMQFKDHIGIDEVWATRSVGGNAHFYIVLNGSMHYHNRLYWQLALGSDRVRGALDWAWWTTNPVGDRGKCFLIEHGDIEKRKLERIDPWGRDSFLHDKKRGQVQVVKGLPID